MSWCSKNGWVEAQEWEEEVEIPMAESANGELKMEGIIGKVM